MKLLTRFKALLGQGLAPAELAWALSLGTVIGLSPLLWGTGLLCAAVAARLRLNQAAIQLANVAMWPLQLLLFVPWLRLGGGLFGVFPEYSQTAAGGPVALVRQYGAGNLQGLLAWLLAAPLAIALLFPLLSFFCRRLLIRRSAGEESGRGA